MKYLIIGDIHFGIKNNAERYYNLIQREFFKWLDVNYGKKGYNLIFLGDLLNNRKYVNNLILSKVIDVFNVLSKDFNEIFLITGNHDYYYKDQKNGGYINIVEKIFNHKSNIKIINRITTDKENEIIYFPFNYDMNDFKKQDYSNYICLGHFEIKSLYYESEVALPLDFFNQFNYTISGHYHQPYIKNNFEYIGTPFDLQFNPKNSIDDFVRKIVEYDSHTKERKYIEYDKKQFHTFVISDEESFKEFYSKTKSLKNKNIRVFIENKFRYGTKKSIIENFIRNLEVKNEEIRIEHFDGNIEDQSYNDIFDEDSLNNRINIFSDNDLKETIVKLVDLNYEQNDIDNFKKYIYNIVDEFSSQSM